MSLLTRILDGVISTVNAIGRKAKITDIALSLIAWIPGAITDLGKIKDETASGRIDAAIEEFKRFTGSEPGALDLDKDLPADKENELFDAMAKIIEILAKHKARVPGYFVPGSAPGSDRELLNALAMSGLDQALIEKIGSGSGVDAAEMIPLNIAINRQAGDLGAPAAQETAIEEANAGSQSAGSLAVQLAILRADKVNVRSLLLADQVDHIRQAQIITLEALI